MVAFIAGLLGLRNVFAVGSGAAVSMVLVVAALAFAVALTLCCGRTDRRIDS